MAENVKMEMSSLTTLDTCVIQVTDVAPSATLEQMSTLFGFLGTVEEIKLYPSDDYPFLPQSRVCYVKFAESWSTAVAQHLTNTIFVDRALIVVPVVDGLIPDETHALSLTSNSLTGLINTGPSQLINSVQTMGSTQVFTTVDPNLTILGLPQYPPLPANIDPSKIEEIRRTVYVGNLDSTTTTEQMLKFFNQVGEVKYVRMAGDETQPTRFAFVEFTDQSSVSKALQYNGIIFGSRPLKVNHSNNAIVKPQAKSSEAAQREIEEAMKRVREAQSLITAAIEPELSLTSSLISAASGSDAGDSRKKETKSSKRSRSRSRSRKRSKSKEKKRSRSRERKRSRSRGRKSVSPRRSSSRARSTSSRSRRRSPKRRSRSRDRKARRTPSPRRSRSRSKERKKRSRRSRSHSPKNSKSSKTSRSDKSKSSPKREKSPKVEKTSPKKDKSPKAKSAAKEVEDPPAPVIKKQPAIPFLEESVDDIPVRSTTVDIAVKSEAQDLQTLHESSTQEIAKVVTESILPSEIKAEDRPKTPKQESPGRESSSSKGGGRRSESKHKSPSHHRSHSSSPHKRKSRSPGGKPSRRKSRSRTPRKKRRSSRSPRRRSRTPRRRKSSHSPPSRRRSHTPSRSRSRSRSVRRKHRSPPRRRSRSACRSPSYCRSRRRSPSPRRRSRSPRRRSRTPRKRSRTRTPPRKENKHKKKKDRDRSRDRDKKKSKHSSAVRSPDKDIHADGSDTKVRRDYDEEEKGYNSSGNEDHREGGSHGTSERDGSPGFGSPLAPSAKAKKNDSDDSDHRSQQMDLDSD